MPATELDNCSDEQLLSLYLQGDVPAMGLLVARYKRPLFTFVARLCGDPARAEDLLQETFLRLIEHADTFEGGAKLRTWLYRIARNLCVDEMRRKKHRRHASMDASGNGVDHGQTLHDRVAAPNPLTDRQVVSAQLGERLMAAVSALPEEQREVFLMRQAQNLAFKEIAEITAVSENTVKSRMRYALERLQSALSEYQDYMEELR